MADLECLGITYPGFQFSTCSLSNNNNNKKNDLLKKDKKNGPEGLCGTCLVGVISKQLGLWTYFFLSCVCVLMEFHQNMSGSPGNISEQQLIWHGMTHQLDTMSWVSWSACHWNPETSDPTCCNHCTVAFVIGQCTQWPRSNIQQL